MSIPLLLAADWDNLLKAIVPLAVFFIWIFVQIANAKKKLPQQPRQPAVPPPGQAGPPGKARVGPPAADPLRAQVDDFLRRAGRQAQPQGAKPAQPAQPAIRRDEVEVLLEEVPPEPARKSLAEPLRPMDEPAASPRPVAPPRKRPPPRVPRRAAPMRQQSVGEHVAQHVGAAVEEIREEVSHLGERVITADEQFDVQMHEKFDHELGGLAVRRAARLRDQQSAAKKADTPAEQIIAMLARPEGIRQAIVVNEILRRPDERW